MNDWRKRAAWFFLVRTFWALLILTVVLLCSGGCGAVTVADSGDGASVGATDAVDASAVEVRRPVASELDASPNMESLSSDTVPETQPPSDAGAVLPACPPEIMWYDCPQPKCYCSRDH